MENLKLYEINQAYIDYLSSYEPLLFHNKKSEQRNERKYIGVVLHINGMDYFAPLSSFKEKHRIMDDCIDFIKIKNYAVINLNNMFPVPSGEYTYVDINAVCDESYRYLLLSEYRCIKSIQDRIKKNAENLYKIKLRDKDTTRLSKCCNNFTLLEEACKKYR